MKIRPQAKIEFQLSRISILLLEWSFKKEKIISRVRNLTHRQIIWSKNFIFAQTFFFIDLSQIFENNAILINHGSFFQGKDSLQLDCFQSLEINSLMVKTDKKHFSETTKSFFWKNDFWFVRNASFLKIWFETIRKKFGHKKNLLIKLFFCVSNFFLGK